MAMFDKGRRTSGESDAELERQGLSEGSGVGPVAPDWQPPGPETARSREAAVVGPSIHIDGTLKGEEDLVIEGRVTGTVELRDNALTIGNKGQLEATIYAHTVVVDGRVDGDIYGSERVSIRSSARVQGNVTAPRISLEDGAHFRGAIEMDPQAVEAAVGGRRSGSAARDSGGGQKAGSVGASASASGPDAASSKTADSNSATSSSAAASTSGGSGKTTNSS